MKNRMFIFLLLILSAFGGQKLIINAFNAGEMTPLLDGRTDIEKYFTGCRTLQNMEVMSYGGATRRPGTKYICQTKLSGQVRLFPFEYSTSDAYVLEFGNLYIRFYKDGAQLQSGGIPYEIVTEYTASELDQIQWVQSADVMYLVHPNHPPQKLSRLTDTSWTIADVEFERGPFLAENETATTITVSTVTISGTAVAAWDGSGAGVAYTSGTYVLNDGYLYICKHNHTSGATTEPGTGASWKTEWNFRVIPANAVVTLHSSSAVFDDEHVGSLWQISQRIPTDSTNASVSSPTTGASDSFTIELDQPYDWSTHGTWTGTIQLERSFDDGTTWLVVKTIVSADDANITLADTEEIDDALYRVNVVALSSGTVTYNFTSIGFVLDGTVEVTTYTDSDDVIGTVKSPLGGVSADSDWSEGAWSDYRGWPRTVAIFEERLTCGGNEYKPQTIWFSKTDDWTNFKTGDLDDDAMAYSIASDQINEIQWIAPQKSLVIGTAGAEWTIGGSSDEALTPLNRNAARHSTYGSDYIQAQYVNNVVLFVQRQAKKVRELTYSFELDNYVSPDMTVLSEHITSTGIRSIAYQKTPDAILWCVRDDGTLAGMTYNREQNVVGWHRQVFDGDVESATVIPGDGEDEVWLSIERVINGSTVRYIEQMQPREFGSDQKDAVFVDCSITFDGGNAKEIAEITQANPAVVSLTAWPTKEDGTDLANGDQVFITGVEGMTEINETVYTVANCDDEDFDFTLKDSDSIGNINSIGYTAYIHGGTVQIVENTISGLDYIEGKTVAICADGSSLGESVVANGAMTLPEYYNTIHIGLPYESIVLPMRLDVPMQGGSIQASKKRILSVDAMFYKTAACSAGPNLTNLTALTFRSITTPTDAPPPLFTGQKSIGWSGSYEKEGNIYLYTKEPLPMTVTALIPDFEIAR